MNAKRTPRPGGIVVHIGALLALLEVLAAGCSSPSEVATCVPGEQPACACPGGGSGIQVCNDDGTFGACQCPEPCTPRDCAEAGAACGVTSDGCGGVLRCGSCSGGRVCDESDAGNTCVCPIGYVEIGGACDVDECALGIDACAPGAVCTNVAGGYTCACPDGWVGDGFA